MANDTHMLVEKQQSLTDKQRARIEENFRAAQARLAQKRHVPPSTPPAMTCKKHLKSSKENMQEFFPATKIRYMHSVKSGHSPKLDKFERTPLGEVNPNEFLSDNLQTANVENYQNTLFNSEGKHNIHFPSSNLLEKDQFNSDSKPYQIQGEQISSWFPYSIRGSQLANGRNPRSMEDSVKPEESMLVGLSDDELDDSLLEEIDALCKKSASKQDIASSGSLDISLEYCGTEVSKGNNSLDAHPDISTSRAKSPAKLAHFNQKDEKGENLLGRDSNSSENVNSQRAEIPVETAHFDENKGKDGNLSDRHSSSSDNLKTLQPICNSVMDLNQSITKNVHPECDTSQSQFEWLEALITVDASIVANSTETMPGDRRDLNISSRQAELSNPTLEAFPSYLCSLNETQKEAATSDISTPLLILAGPGSGKTSTMVARLLTLVKEGVQPKHILAMTFTTAAATEMRERVGAVVGRSVAKELSISTFHSFCLQLCRLYAEKLGRNSEFLVYGHSQQRRAVIEAVRLSTTEQQMNGGDDTSKRICTDIKGSIEPIKEKAKRWQTFVTQAKSSGKTPEDCDRIGDKAGASILRHYNCILKSCNALDYHDLISCAIMLLRDYKEVFLECQNTWTAILVDEFQDTSSMQYCFLKLLASHKRITVVGDDDQSIFSFNGADVSGFDSFRRDFPTHKEVRLHQNYRSTRCIVEAASCLIQNNMSRSAAKQAFTDNVPGDKIIIKECRNEEAQCAYVVDSILMATRDHDSNRPSYSKFAILYRRQVTGKLFQSTLLSRKIPFNTHGVAFYRKKLFVVDDSSQCGALGIMILIEILIPKLGIAIFMIIKVAIAMLHIALPSCPDSYYRCVFKALYAGEKTEKRKAVEYIERVASSTKTTFQITAREVFTAKVSGTFSRQQLAQGRRVLSIMDNVYNLVRKEDSLTSVITSILNFIPQKYLFEKRAVVNEEGGKLLNEDDDPRSVLDYLLDDVSDFLLNNSTLKNTDESQARHADDVGCINVLKSFLDYLSSREMENFRARRVDNCNSVTLTTIHQSKGLEWDTVFIVKANDMEIPLLHESIGSVKNGGNSLEEERRLFYVAMTRAKKTLYILYIVTDSNRQLLQPSRFLTELPRDLLDVRVESLNSKMILESSHDVNEHSDMFNKGETNVTESYSTTNRYTVSITKGDEPATLIRGDLNAGNSFLKGFNIEARSMIASLFHTWAKKRAFQDPKRLLDKVGFVVDERIRSKASKNKDVLRALKCCLKDDEALLYAEHVLKWEMLPLSEKSLLQTERQEHFQRQAVERAMDSAGATSKQIAYLQQLGCTINPTSRLHASRLIEQYKKL